MTISGGLTFEFNDGRPAEHARFAVDAPDARMLRSYLAEALVLEQTINGWGGIDARLQISGRIGEPIQITATEPSPDHRAILLHRLRPFLLEREPFSFHRVRGALNRASASDFLRMRLREIKQLYSGEHLRSQVRIEINDLVVNSEVMLDRWLNAFEYHRDEAEAIELIRQHEPIPLDASRPIFIGLLVDKCKAILNLAHIISKMLEMPVEPRAPEA
jgi:hypothetical protein